MIIIVVVMEMNYNDIAAPKFVDFGGDFGGDFDVVNGEISLLSRVASGNGIKSRRREG